ncbi:MAG TPA: amidinotransferase [Thermoanaerobaculia bacterium]|nr:amidinotransferase [Thermoanaerobaculia bacterium]
MPETLAEAIQVVADTRAVPAVCAYNEWDPLEEVVVGVVDGAAVPSWDSSLQATMPTEHWPFFQQQGGKPFPPDLVAAARRDLEELVHILEAEGVTVRRPEPLDFVKPYATPEWSTAGGLYAAMPRDLLLVVGDEIIEAPMAWRSRYFEIHAYRPLLKDYFQRGARWTAAPKPQLNDDLYKRGWEPGDDGTPFDSVITEFEPTFDAADFVRCGRDLFAQQSHVTNRLGIEWLRRHLGDRYRIHEIEIADTHPMHIDATFMPLAPGKLLVNRERLRSIPSMFHSWDILEAPEPCRPAAYPLYMSSSWISMNVFMLDEERVMVERHEETTIRKLRDWGFKPIPCNFVHFNAFGGSFHCATLDVRRRGGLRSYF